MRKRHLTTSPWLGAVTLLLVAAEPRGDLVAEQASARLGRTQPHVEKLDCTTKVGFDMFVPSPHELCPPPLEVARAWSKLAQGAREYSVPKTLAAILADLPLGPAGCSEVWVEKWIKCGCENSCLDSRFWVCDCPHTEFGQLPDTRPGVWPIAIETSRGEGGACRLDAKCGQAPKPQPIR